MHEWLPWVLTIIGSVLASWVTFRIKFERFQSMDAQREKDWTAWRGRVEERIDRIDTRLREHERFCDTRWNDMNEKVGEIRGRFARDDR